MHLPDRSVTVRHLSHLIVSTSRPEHFNLLAPGVCHDLTADICLVGLVEDVNAHINNHIGIVNLFVGSETKLLDTKCLTTSQAWHTSHQLLNISRLHGMVPWRSHLSIQFLYILHGPGAIVCWNGSTLTHRVDVSHVIDGRRRARVERFDVCVDVLSSWELFGHQMRLVVERVVRTMTKDFDFSYGADLDANFDSIFVIKCLLFPM